MSGGYRRAEPETMSKPATNFFHALTAVLAGNALYYLLEQYLPKPAHHVIFKTDLGTLVDFLFCAAVFIVIKLLAADRKPPEPSGK